MPRTRKKAPLLCPEPLHEHSRVVSFGSITTSAGKVLRFRCTPLDGSTHYFTVGSAGGRRQRGQRGAPSCPEHPDATVTRNGTYGPEKHVRQRYLCEHEVCSPSCATRWRREHKACPGWHTFTPDIPRHHVHAGDRCGDCLELRGIHRGERMVARRRRLTSRQTARLLSEEAGGMSYAKAGRMALGYMGVKIVAGVLRRKPGAAQVAREVGRIIARSFRRAQQRESLEEPWPEQDAPAPTSTVAPITGAAHPPLTPPRRRRSPSTRLSARLWHIGADLVESFAPVVWDDLDARLRAHSEKIADAGHLRVWIVDDKPYYTDVTGKRKLVMGYSVLVLAELDPLDEALPWSAKLRLARAYPRANNVAYRLLFDEMGYEPDLIIADGGKAISAAVTNHYGGRVKTVPDVWHMVESLKVGILEAALRKDASGDLRHHLDSLARNSPHLRSAEGWGRWWDTLFTLAQARGVGIGPLVTARNTYEARLAEALPVLLANSALPLSNAPIEALISDSLDPIFTRRRQFSFGNIERTNSLLNLVVAKAHGVFADLNRVAALIEKDEEKHAGWQPPVRAIADPQPADGRYRSLRDETAMLDVAAERGIA